ncbi:MAG TPA: galactokinase [Gemmatimonadota bacterium]
MVGAGHVPRFEALYGRPPTATGEAHGRANLIGEHTDYNGGYVLPTAVPQRTRVELAPRTDGLVQAATDAPGAGGDRGGAAAYALGSEARGRGWLDYVQGVTLALREAGHATGGFDARVTSDLPAGAGLSSSAALTVGLLRALRAAFGLDLADVPLARVAQAAENGLVGARVGILDPIACTLAEEGSGLFLDTRSLAWELVPLPADAAVGVLHSGVAHDHAHGGYNARRAECERACELLGVSELRDLAPDDLPRAERLPEPLGRRVRHVVTENARVLETVAAFRAGDAARAGRLFLASHRSLRDDYEVSTTELDLIVALASEDDAVHGARLTGGGFGGSVVMLVRAGEAAAAGRRIAATYARRSGRTPAVLVPPERGAE